MAPPPPRARTRAHAELIKGFFSDSLTPTLKAERQMKPALLIDVDVDLYISCLQCMDWMLANEVRSLASHVRFAPLSPTP